MMQKFLLDFEESEIFLLALLSVLLVLSTSRFISASMTIKSEKNHKRIVKITFIISLAAYISSLFCDCFYSNTGNGEIGLVLLIFGGIWVLAGGSAITWLANPLLWYAWAKRSDTRKSRYASFLSFFVSLLFLSFDNVPGAGGCGGTDGMISHCDDLKIYSYGLGYYLWLASSLVFLIGHCFRQEKNAQIL
jgi:hypothetical protein